MSWYPKWSPLMQWGYGFWIPTRGDECLLWYHFSRGWVFKQIVTVMMDNLLPLFTLADMSGWRLQYFLWCLAIAQLLSLEFYVLLSSYFPGPLAKESRLFTLGMLASATRNLVCSYQKENLKILCPCQFQRHKPFCHGSPVFTFF